MSGHSHWAGIKHKKAINDARRGKLFSKLGKAISVATREKGGDPAMNLGLRAAIDAAGEANMPKDNIERAIKRGTGELGGATLEEIILEAYTAEGVALIIEAITDNKNRTFSEIKKILSDRGAKLAGEGSARWMFEKTRDGWAPKTAMEIDDEQKVTIEKLFEALDENDDVQDIYSNLK